LYDGGDGVFVELQALHQSSSSVVIRPAASQQQASGDAKGMALVKIKMKMQTIA